MRTPFLLLSLIAVAGCGGNESQEVAAPGADAPAQAGPVVPEPSGPPGVQQAQPDAGSAGIQAGLKWEGAGGTLRLLNPDGSVRMSIACSSRTIRATVPSFTPVGSEDRFALGIGEEPVTLVADPNVQKSGAGVTGEGPVPDNLGTLLEAAQEVSALYGAQRIGPHIPPPPEMGSAFAKSCGG